MCAVADSDFVSDEPTNGVDPFRGGISGPFFISY
jgi:hypothetical protein